MSTLTFDEFCRVVTATLPTSDIRYGQHWFNVLNAIRPDLANLLRMSPLDPFFHETVSDEAVTLIASKW